MKCAPFCALSENRMPLLATMIRRFMLDLLDWSLGSAMGAILLVSAMLLLLLTSALGGRQRAS